jgi:hypothetical protein
LVRFIHKLSEHSQARSTLDNQCDSNHQLCTAFNFPDRLHLNNKVNDSGVILPDIPAIADKPFISKDEVQQTALTLSNQWTKMLDPSNPSLLQEMCVVQEWAATSSNLVGGDSSNTGALISSTNNGIFGSPVKMNAQELAALASADPNTNVVFVPVPLFPPEFSKEPVSKSVLDEKTEEIPVNSNVQSHNNKPAWWADQYVILGPLSARARRTMYLAQIRSNSSPSINRTSANPQANDLMHKLHAIVLTTASEADRQSQVYSLATSALPESGTLTELLNVSRPKETNKEAILGWKVYAGSLADFVRRKGFSSGDNRSGDSRMLSVAESRTICLFVLGHMGILSDLDLIFVDNFKLGA